MANRPSKRNYPRRLARKFASSSTRSAPRRAAAPLIRANGAPTPKQCSLNWSAWVKGNQSGMDIKSNIDSVSFDAARAGW